MTLILSLVVLSWLTWGVYLSVIHLKEARDAGRLTPIAKVLGYPWLAFALVLDVLFNFVVGSILFVEPPKEFLFTTRVSRWNDKKGRRGDIARWFCSELLDPFDAGSHCR